ncbi:ATP synthase F1 subunit epsilon [Oceanivirga miroungae]|uniref:ATP synthase epsilon chain n=1 Tax=Oceanivirga miroungae TaxID=1130046 RepID=A0A6I8MBU3_9FUSO|nr:ATP synthase F1 subunit epsilon [Oceanivirga miroungae]VWL84897.1 ATP synthase F1 subunit epsilon [Oceanivirga miroungae]
MKDKKSVLSIEVVSPMGSVFSSSDVVFVKVKGSRGDVGILPNHTNYVTSLGAGQMLVRFSDKKEESYFVDGGFLEIRDNRIIVIAEDIYESSKEEIIKKERKEAIERATREKLSEDRDVLGTKKRIQDSLRN